MPLSPVGRRPCILVIGPVPPPFGGVETVTESVLRSRLAIRYRLIHLNTTQHRGSAARGFTTRNALVALARYCLLLWLVARHQPTVVYLPINSTRAGFLRDSGFVLLARLLRRRIIGHVHGGTFDQLCDIASPRQRALIRWVLNQLTAMIALSGYWRDYLGGLVPPARVTVVPNGVDLATLPMEPPTPQRSQGLHQQGHAATEGGGDEAPPTHSSCGRVLFLGSLGQRKGIFDLLQAIALVRQTTDVSLTCAGLEENRGEGAQVRRLCRDLQLTKVVSFPGAVYGPAKLRLLREADVFVLPSHAENMPMAVLEAMAVGLPVVTTPVGALPEVITSGVNGLLVSPGDIHALAAAVLDLLHDPHRRVLIGAAAASTVRQRYSLEHTVAALDDLFARVAGYTG